MMFSAGKPGFSLVEVVVSAAIIVLLATIVIMQVRGLSPSQALAASHDDVRSALVLARSYTLTGRLCCGDILPNGYGLFAMLDGHPDNTALLYADLDDTKNYSDGDGEISQVTLPDNVDITVCEDDISSIAAGTCDLFFSASTGNTVYLNGASLTERFVMTLTEADTGLTASVQVHGFGIIE